MMIAACCAVMILPAWCLANFGWPKVALMVSAGMTALLWLDRHENWDGLTYPAPLLWGPTYFYGLTFPAGLIACAISIKAIYDQA